ncbi:MAG: exodeoxyribonuclease VII small subunit [Gammaproteobacteria bacterium]
MAKAKPEASQPDAAAATPADVPLEFEAAMHELEALVDKLEQGEYSLEESLRQYERGIALTRACEQALRNAEQKVLALARNGDDDVLQDFALSDDAED